MTENGKTLFFGAAVFLAALLIFSLVSCDPDVDVDVHHPKTTHTVNHKGGKTFKVKPAAPKFQSGTTKRK